MKIKELCTEVPNPYVTVTLSYDEVKDLSNGLYERCKMDESGEFLDIYKKAATLFGLVKDGKITSHLLHTLNEKDTHDFV